MDKITIRYPSLAPGELWYSRFDQQGDVLWAACEGGPGMAKTEVLPLAPIENYDPFARFLRQTLRLSPLSFALWIFVLDLIVDAWMGFYYNLWLSPEGSVFPGILQDFTTIVVDFGSIPIIAGLYLWSTEGATSLFQQLSASGVFPETVVIKDEVEKSRPFFASKFVFILITTASVLYAVSQLAAYQNWVPWQSAGGYINLAPVAAYYRTPFWLLNFYTFLFAIYNIVITVIVLRRLFRTKGLRILPLHPDKCGGAISISQYTIKIAYGIASAGLVISGATVFALQTSTLAKSYPIILGIIAYLILAPVLFFWPLGTAHAAMREAKDAQLLQLARRFDATYSQLNSEVVKDADFETNLKKLENIKKLYAITLEFPVWPFDTSNLRRFFAVITAPLVPAAISIGIDILRGFIIK